MLELFEQYDILGAFKLTVYLTLAAALGSLVIGTIVAIMRVSPSKVLRAFGSSYVTVLRNTPLTVVLVACSLGLWSSLGVTLAGEQSPTFFEDNNFRLAVLGLSAYHAAFVCEAIRSGVNTIPLGQAEAARSIGLTFSQSLSQIVLPQAFRGAITPLGNVLIALTKNTTVASVIGVAEASALMSEMIEFRPDVIMMVFLIFAMGFVILTLPTGLFFGWLSQKVAVKR